MGQCGPNAKKSNKQDNQFQQHDIDILLENVHLLDEGKALYIKGIKFTKNLKTGQLQTTPLINLPAKFNQINFKANVINLTNLPKAPQHNHLNISANKCQEQNSFMPEGILNLMNGNENRTKTGTVQTTQNNMENLQLEPDSSASYGIKNLTSELIDILHESKISPSQARKNTMGLIQMLNTYKKEVLEKKVDRHINLMTMKDFEGKINQITFIQQNPSKKYKFSDQLGKGANCKVYVAKQRKDKQNIYAVRIMKINDYKKLEKIKRQIAVMNMCTNQNIVSYYFSYYYKNLLFMFIEYMGGGCLTDFIYKYYCKIPERIIAYIIREILIGLNALHEKRQIHRDLKSDNILIGSMGQVKIADFGFAIQLTKQKDNRVSCVGTPAWMAPELIQKKQYDQAVDIWSLGIVAIELCKGQPPFLMKQQMKSMYLIVSEQAPRLNEDYSPELLNFVQNCLQKEPSKRLTAGQLLKHNFIMSIGDGKQQRNQFIQMLFNN